MMACRLVRCGSSVYVQKKRSCSSTCWPAEACSDCATLLFCPLCVAVHTVVVATDDDDMLKGQCVAGVLLVDFQCCWLPMYRQLLRGLAWTLETTSLAPLVLEAGTRLLDSRINLNLILNLTLSPSNTISECGA